MRLPAHGAGGFLEDAELEYAWFFRTEYPTVLRTVFLILHDQQKAEDISQEAFIQLLAHWRKVSRYERPDAWVRRVAIRLAVRHQKRERIRGLLERQTERETISEAHDIDLARAVGRLPMMQRAAVVLFYFEDRPIAEIADILSISSSTAKVHLHRARARLAELLGEEVDEDAR
jgi:RNA polymerase sigma-70 factor (ECF subfamily)